MADYSQNEYWPDNYWVANYWPVYGELIEYNVEFICAAPIVLTDLAGYPTAELTINGSPELNRC